MVDSPTGAAITFTRHPGFATNQKPAGRVIRINQVTRQQFGMTGNELLQQNLVLIRPTRYTLELVLVVERVDPVSSGHLNMACRYRYPRANHDRLLVRYTRS